jgi:glucose/arabinose dehydrogenase
LFIIEQVGRIRVVLDGDLLEAPFLDLSDSVSCCGEWGLFSLAFAPDYADSGRFFVNYTDTSGDTAVSSFLVSEDPNSADADSENRLLRVAQLASNHNGGQIAFGPDGFLYIGMGDGGFRNDPGENGQNPETLLGALLRLDVSGNVPVIPADNPYADGGGAPEVFSIGLRNPWRFSFDRETGDLYIGDVGQNAREEISFASFADGLGNGANYGWDDCEGDRDFEGSCDGHVAPVLVYDNPGEGCSVTGGHVYRGCAMPDLHGTYFYGDYCTSFVRTFRIDQGAATDQRDVTDEMGLTDASLEVTSFGEDARGELYIAMHSAGQVLRIVPVRQP